MRWDESTIFKYLSNHLFYIENHHIEISRHPGIVGTFYRAKKVKEKHF